MALLNQKYCINYLIIVCILCHTVYLFTGNNYINYHGHAIGAHAAQVTAWKEASLVWSWIFLQLSQRMVRTGAY